MSGRKTKLTVRSEIGNREIGHPRTDLVSRSSRPCRFDRGGRALTAPSQPQCQAEKQNSLSDRRSVTEKSGIREPISSAGVAGRAASTGAGERLLHPASPNVRQKNKTHCQIGDR